MVKGESRKDSLLRLINDIGGEGKHRDFCGKIRDYWELTEEENKNEKKLFHHVASIEQALKTSGFVKLQGGIWKITEEGKKLIASMGYKLLVRPVVTQEPPIIGDLPLCKELRESQRNSENPAIFEGVLVKTFQQLGFPAKHIGGRDEPDIFINDQFNIIFDSKTTKEGVITERYINFDAMERYKEKYNATYIGVVAPGFSEGYIRETAKRKGIVLIETETICKILQNYAIYPYEPKRIVEILFESGKHVITPKDVPPSTIDQEKLIEIAAKILSTLKNFERSGISPFSSNTVRIALVGQGYTYKIGKIEDALKFLSTAPFSILQKQEDEYSLTGDIESILKKIGLLLQAFNQMGR